MTRNPPTVVVRTMRSAGHMLRISAQVEKAYFKGVDAFNNGLLRSANEFSGSSIDQVSWDCGWRDAERGTVKEKSNHE